MFFNPWVVLLALVGGLWVGYLMWPVYRWRAVSRGAEAYWVFFLVGHVAAFVVTRLAGW